MHILLIEDNKEISENIKNILELDWFKVTQIFDWTLWLEVALLNDFDLIILDLMLPGLDWITICKKLREKKDTPIIMVTAKWDDDDKILWLESGADDYIVKPFKVKELEIRINKIFKRLWVSDIVKIDDLEIDLKLKIVKKDSKIIKLKLKEYQVLEYILKNKIVSRTDLIDYIWWNEDVLFWDNNLDVYISLIRKKLNKDIIKTIKWYWYSIKNWGITK